MAARPRGAEAQGAFARDITLLQYLGIHPVVVHGGGPQIGKVLAQMDIPTRFVEGLRVTDESTMDVVEMVLAGKINKEIVNPDQHRRRHRGGPERQRRPAAPGPETPVLPAPGGRAPGDHRHRPGGGGDRGEHRPDPHPAGQHFIPVIAPVGVGEAGETYNINADLVAGAVAEALKRGQTHPAHRRGRGPGREPAPGLQPGPGRALIMMEEGIPWAA